MKSATKCYVEPIAVGLADATRITGISRSELYRMLADGRIRAVKHGVRTLIPVDSLKAHIARLPPAHIRSAA